MKTTTLWFSLLLTTALTLSAQTPPYNRTVIVPSTGNITADGAALIAALGGLSPAPSYLNRWLIKLEPGIYNVGTTPVVMRAYVDIEGSGIVETQIRGSVAPPPALVLGGLVEGASNAEIRQLTINCISNAAQPSCQAMSLAAANPRLSQLRILVQGTGAGFHWGIRTVDSAPQLKDVEIKVTAANSIDNYGIVYGGQSTMNIDRSAILVRNGSSNNWAIFLREDIGYSVIKNSSVTAIGGSSANAVILDAMLSSQNFLFDNVILSAHGGSRSIGIEGLGSLGGVAKIWFRAGRVHGATQAIGMGAATVRLTNTEVSTDPSSQIAVSANAVRVGSTWIRGGGSVVGSSSAICAGVFTDSFTFYPNQCP